MSARECGAEVKRGATPDPAVRARSGVRVCAAGDPWRAPAIRHIHEHYGNLSRGYFPPGRPGQGWAGQGRRPALRSTEMMDELDWAELSLLSLAITRVTIINHFIILHAHITHNLHL